MALQQPGQLQECCCSCTDLQSDHALRLFRRRLSKLGAACALGSAWPRKSAKTPGLWRSTAIGVTHAAIASRDVSQHASSSENENESQVLHGNLVDKAALPTYSPCQGSSHLSAPHDHMDPRLPSNGRHSPQRLPSSLQDRTLLQMHLQILLHLQKYAQLLMCFLGLSVSMAVVASAACPSRRSSTQCCLMEAPSFAGAFQGLSMASMAGVSLGHYPPTT